MVYKVQVIREVQQSVVVEVELPLLVPSDWAVTKQGLAASAEIATWVKNTAEDIAAELSDSDWRDEESVIDDKQTSILGTDEEEAA